MINVPKKGCRKNGHYPIQFVLSHTPGTGEAPHMMVTRLRPLRDTAGREIFLFFFELFVPDPPRGASHKGAAAFIVPD